MTLSLLEDLRRVIIVGPGLLGASLALALRKRVRPDLPIVGVARSDQTLEIASERGAIDEGFHDVGEAIAADRDGPQLLVLCTPLSSFEAIFKAIGQGPTDQLIMTDVGSTKGSVCELAEAHLPDPGRFLAAHPMAGSEQQGPAGADADLFEGKPCIVCPGETTDGSVQQRIEALWSGVGMSVVAMSAHEHDRQTALTSHLPHLAAVLLARVARAEGGMDVASTGFRDTTRLASSNPPMRADILVANREAIGEALDALEAELADLRQALEDANEPALLKRLEEAKAFRDQWLEDGGP